MAWPSTLPTFSPGEYPPASKFQALSDAVAYLHGDAGAIGLVNHLQLAGFEARFGSTSRFAVRNTGGFLDLADTTGSGHASLWSGVGIQASATTVLPASSLTKMLLYTAMVRNDTTGLFSDTTITGVAYQGWLTTSQTYTIYQRGTPATDAVTLTTSSGGLTIQRSVGSGSYSAVLWLLWM